jgi:hypothetical protein
LKTDIGLLLADFLEREHNRAQGVNVFDWLVDLDADLLYLVGQLLQQVFGLLVQFSGEGVFPGIYVRFE